MVAEDSATAERLMTFRVGRGRFAVSLDDVLGVQDPAQIAAGDAVVTFQGRAVPAVDARRLGWGGASLTTGAGVAIVVGGVAATALIVDRVEGIVAGLAVQPLPRLLAPFVRGVFRGIAPQAEGGRLVLDPAALAAATGKTTAGGGRGGPKEA
jgi:chemotaxis protein histidine kinase CheA